jgi:hypothetical protein
MNYKQWDVVKVEGFLLGLPDGSPDQFGVVISTPNLVKDAQRYWILQVPDPVPDASLPGDIEIERLHAVIPAERFVIRTHTIFTIHEMDLEGPAASHLPEKYRKGVMKSVKSYLPRSGFGF